MRKKAKLVIFQFSELHFGTFEAFEAFRKTKMKKIKAETFLCEKKKNLF